MNEKFSKEDVITARGMLTIERVRDGGFVVYTPFTEYSPVERMFASSTIDEAWAMSAIASSPQEIDRRFYG